MGTDMTAKLAEVNSWVDENFAWFNERMDEYSTTSRKLEKPRLVDVDITLPAIVRVDRTLVGKQLKNSMVCHDSAIDIHSNTMSIARKLRAMAKLHNEDWLIKEAKAAEAVANVAFAINNYHRSVKDLLPQYQFATAAEIVVHENFLKIRHAQIAVTAIDSLIGFQTATVDTFKGSKVHQDWERAYLAAMDICATFKAIYGQLYNETWAEKERTATPRTDTGVFIATNRTHVGHGSTSTQQWRNNLAIVALIILAGLIYPLWERLSH